MECSIHAGLRHHPLDCRKKQFQSNFIRNLFVLSRFLFALFPNAHHPYDKLGTRVSTIFFETWDSFGEQARR